MSCFYDASSPSFHTACPNSGSYHQVLPPFPSPHHLHEKSTLKRLIINVFKVTSNTSKVNGGEKTGPTDMLNIRKLIILFVFLSWETKGQFSFMGSEIKMHMRLRCTVLKYLLHKSNSHIYVPPKTCEVYIIKCNSHWEAFPQNIKFTFLTS